MNRKGREKKRQKFTHEDAHPVVPSSVGYENPSVLRVPDSPPVTGLEQASLLHGRLEPPPIPGGVLPAALVFSTRA